jgi:hypothetical protein
METTLENPQFNRSTSRKQSRAGLVLSALPVLFLVFDSAIKFTTLPAVLETFEQLGYSPSTAPLIGGIELFCLVTYVIPRTSALGALLLTGFLGGAIATHLRVGDPVFSHTLFPVYVAALLWSGLALRSERVRALFRSLLNGEI